MLNFIQIKTEDNIQMTINKDIRLMSQLFDDLISNYDIRNASDETMKGIYSNDLKMLIDFCEKCNYKPIELSKQFWKYSVSDQLSSLNESIQKFYSALSIKEMCDYLKICDFYTVPFLEEIIYLKLYDIFTSKQGGIDDYFSLQCKDLFQMDIKTEINLHQKYSKYCQIQEINEMNDDELNAYCERFY